MEHSEEFQEILISIWKESLQICKYYLEDVEEDDVNSANNVKLK